MCALFKTETILVELGLSLILKNIQVHLILLILKILLEELLLQELVIFLSLDKERNLGLVYLKEMVCMKLCWNREKENYLTD